MLVGVFPAHKDETGEWRFALMAYEDNMTNGRVLLGTEPDEDGMLETKFRSVLAESFKLSPTDIERAVAVAKGDKTGGEKDG